jgi:hypothetical protein
MAANPASIIPYYNPVPLSSSLLRLFVPYMVFSTGVTGRVENCICMMRAILLDFAQTGRSRMGKPLEMRRLE